MSGQPIEPFGNGNELVLSLVMVHRNVHSCRETAVSNSTNSTDVTAVASTDKVVLSSNRVILG